MAARPSQRNPSWVPYGGMPAPTRNIVEALQSRLGSSPKSETGIFEQMQGLCTTWDFLKNTFQPIVKEFLRRPTDIMAKKMFKYRGDEYPTTLPGQRMQIWQVSDPGAFRALCQGFFNEVLANRETCFLLRPHSQAVVEAGRVKNRFADVAMPRPDEYPYRYYPAMAPAIYPVPHTLRQTLLLDLMANIAYLMRNSRPKYRSTEPFAERVDLHEPGSTLNPSSRYRRVRLHHCPDGVRLEHDDGPHIISLWDLTDKKGWLNRFTKERLHKEVVKAGYYKNANEYWLRYTGASDHCHYRVGDDCQLQSALRDLESHGNGGDSDDMVLDVVGDPGNVPLDILERLLITDEELGIEFDFQEDAPEDASEDDNLGTNEEPGHNFEFIEETLEDDLFVPLLDKNEEVDPNAFEGTLQDEFLEPLLGMNEEVDPNAFQGTLNDDFLEPLLGANEELTFDFNLWEDAPGDAVLEKNRQLGFGSGEIRADAPEDDVLEQLLNTNEEPTLNFDDFLESTTQGDDFERLLNTNEEPALNFDDFLVDTTKDDSDAIASEVHKVHPDASADT